MDAVRTLVLLTAVCLSADLLVGPAVARAADPIEGVWTPAGHPETTVDVTATSTTSFQGVLHGAQVCQPGAEGSVVWQITGAGGSYTGMYQWRSAPPECAPLYDDTATWSIAGATLQVCTTSPTGSERFCTDYSKLPTTSPGCVRAGASLTTARKGLKRARTLLERARKAGGRKRIVRAKRRARVAKRKVARAREHRREACATA
ncbi:MAG TPA: DUF4398 domain-containing protein [Thermoleophilaceae bacterium]|jgi:hypothetical protein